MITLLLLVIPPIWRAAEDSIEISQGKSINYSKRNRQTVFIILVCAMTPYAVGRAAIVEVLFLAIATHWLFFDYILNAFRKKPVLTYYGDFNDEKNLSFIERNFYKRVSWRTLLAMKLIVFTVAIWIYEF